jgi:hypothetical protein
MTDYTVTFVADYFTATHSLSAKSNADTDSIVSQANDFLYSHYGIDFASFSFDITVEEN